MVSLLDFINSISQTDDIQDVSARKVGGKVTFQPRLTAPTPPPGYGTVLYIRFSKFCVSSLPFKSPVTSLSKARLLSGHKTPAA